MTIQEARLEAMRALLAIGKSKQHATEDRITALAVVVNADAKSEEGGIGFKAGAGE